MDMPANGETNTTREPSTLASQYSEDDFFYELLAEIRTR